MFAWEADTWPHWPRACAHGSICGAKLDYSQHFHFQATFPMVLNHQRIHHVPQCASTAQMGSGRASAGLSARLRPGLGTWPALACQGDRPSGLRRVQSCTPTALVLALKITGDSTCFLINREVTQVEGDLQANPGAELSAHWPRACAHGFHLRC